MGKANGFFHFFERLTYDLADLGVWRSALLSIGGTLLLVALVAIVLIRCNEDKLIYSPSVETEDEVPVEVDTDSDSESDSDSDSDSDQEDKGLVRDKKKKIKLMKIKRAVPTLVESGFPANYVPESFSIETEDRCVLDAQLFRCALCRNGAKKDIPTLFYCHENAGSLEYRYPFIYDILTMLGVNVFVFDYRGFGRSTGTPSERGLCLDAEAALQFLLTQSELIDTNRIILYGRSLGGAVAVHLATTVPHLVRGCILENTFASIPELFSSYVAGASLLKRFLRNKWDSVQKIKQAGIKIPFLLLVSELDDIVPMDHMELLNDTLEANCRGAEATVSYHIMSKAHHLDGYNVDPEYYPIVRTWILANHMNFQEPSPFISLS